METPKFKVGDRVKFIAAKEIDTGKFYPVWNGNRITMGLDNDDTECWVTGKVTSVNPALITVSFKDPQDSDITTVWGWNNVGNKAYNPNQWERDGFLAFADGLAETAPGDPAKCVCAWDLVMRQGCCCGAMARERAAKPKPKYNMRDYL